MYVIQCRRVHNDVNVAQWVPWIEFEDRIFETKLHAMRAIINAGWAFNLAGYSNNLYRLEMDQDFQFRFIRPELIPLSVDADGYDKYCFDCENGDEEIWTKVPEESPWKIDFEKEL